ncbi:hypothetical protein BDF22DRAFT_654741 [Syncephalis plumigaleata]|nr:hypothetical protein BDF22DRAFT_654741 [Syncephalis plumigaleata]
MSQFHYLIAAAFCAIAATIGITGSEAAFGEIGDTQSWRRATSREIIQARTIFSIHSTRSSLAKRIALFTTLSWHDTAGLFNSKHAMTKSHSLLEFYHKFFWVLPTCTA